MRTILWEVTYPAPPKTYKYCKKCGTRTAFQSSNCFRVNANQKSLDVWLIYRCVHCKTTWNLTLLSRVNPKSIPKEDLQKFMDNDAAFAHAYAMDTELLARCGAETDPPDFIVAGEPVDFTEPAKLIIKSQVASKLKVSKVLRAHLGLSHKTFDSYIEKGVLSMDDGCDAKKQKLQNGCEINIAAHL